VSVRVAASTDTTRYLNNLKRKKKQKHDRRTKERKCVRTEEVASAAWEAGPSKLRFSCRADWLFSYKMKLSQPLSEDGIARQYAFAKTYEATGGQSGCLESHTLLQ
jgi:hypothetical protein